MLWFRLRHEFKWECRYSQTEKGDKHGRWARLCYYNNKLICWINRINHIDYGTFYSVKDFFPTIKQDDPCFYVGAEKKKDFDTLKKEVEERFKTFLNDIE